MANEDKLSARLRDMKLELCSLPQAIIRLCDLLSDIYPHESEEEVYERIRFQANTSQAFAARDIQTIEVAKPFAKYNMLVTLNFLNLVGASSPLPYYYNENNDSAIPDFLNIFHHRIHQLVWKVIKKYRYSLSFRLDSTDKISQNLFNLMGVNNYVRDAYPNINWRKLLPFSSILIGQYCSARSLELILTHYLGINVRIEECQISHIQFSDDQLSYLGSVNSSLGSHASLGEQLTTRAIKFRIHLDDLIWNQCSQFLMNGEQMKTLNQLILFCLKTPCEYDVALHLRSGEIQPLCLDSTHQQFFGWSTWLGPSQDNCILLSEGTYSEN